MKSNKKFILFVALVTIISFLTIAAMADGPSPPNPNPPPVPGGTHGQAGNVGAPIDKGLLILLVLGAGYGAFKLYRFSRKKEKAME
jgi:hypothetical protein